MLYGKICFSHTTYQQIFHMLYEQNISSIQHMKNLLICCMNNLSICHIEKDISDDTEQVHNESINMNYLRKRYMNIAPIGHNVSYT